MESEAPIVPIGATIPAAWTWRRLDSICEGIFDCPHSTPKLTDAGPFVVRTQDVRTGTFRTDQAARVSEDTYRKRIVRAEPRVGDLLFSREGTYFGHAAEVPIGVRVCLGQRMVLIRPNPCEVDSTFLRFWINSPFMAAYVAGYRDGSVAERLNLPTIRALPVGMPPLAVQGAIARVLGALDDKIELNRRINATLEAMARALFKSWFVEFDAGSDALPDGWREGSISDVATSRRDTVHPKEVRRGSAYVGLEHMPRGRIFLEELGAPDKLESLKARFDEGEILFGKLRPYFKKVALAPCSGICSTDILVLKPKPAARAFTLLLAASEAFIDHAVALSDGTKMPRTSWEQITRYPVAIPPTKVLLAFEEACRPLMARAESLRHESDTLARLRDTLLPRLLSGELSVADAEAAL